MSHALNAFESVRPRGTTAPSAVPRPHNVGRAPGLLPGSGVPKNMAMDRTGKLCVPLEPRASSSGLVESRAQSQASADKRRKLAKSAI